MKLWVTITLGAILAIIFVVAFVPQVWFPAASSWSLFSTERNPQLFVTPAPRYPEYPPVVRTDCAEFLFQHLCLTVPWEVADRVEFAGRVRFTFEGGREMTVSTNKHNPDFARILLTLLGPKGTTGQSFYQGKNLKGNYDLTSLVLAVSPKENEVVLPSEMPAQFILLLTKLFHTPRGSDMVIQRFATGTTQGFQFGIAKHHDPIKIYAFDNRNREYTLLFSGPEIDQRAIDSVLWSLEPL